MILFIILRQSVTISVTVQSDKNLQIKNKRVMPIVKYNRVHKLRTGIWYQGYPHGHIHTHTSVHIHCFNKILKMLISLFAGTRYEIVRSETIEGNQILS